MEYTKDIILDIRYKREFGIAKLKTWTSKFAKAILNNKVMVVTLTILSTLMIIDIVLINSFLEVLSSIY